MTKREIEDAITKAILGTPVGKGIEINFPGLVFPVVVTIGFSDGWEFSFTLLPGQMARLVRGNQGDLNISITIRDPTSHN